MSTNLTPYLPLVQAITSLVDPVARDRPAAQDALPERPHRKHGLFHWHRRAAS